MDKETIKIVCIGDSITFGEMLDDIEFESYSAQLEMLLGDKYVVGNFGRNGTCVWRYSPLPYLSISMRLKWQPILSLSAKGAMILQILKTRIS